MKKNIILVAIITFLFSFVNVKAEESQTIKVGDVDAEVYSMSIWWEDMNFNYLYNEYKDGYEWVTTIDPGMSCGNISLSSTNQGVEFNGGTPYDSWNEVLEERNNQKFTSHYAYESPGYLTSSIEDVGNRLFKSDLNKIQETDNIMVCSYVYVNQIVLYDESRGGKVCPQISWERNDAYSFVDIKGYVWNTGEPIYDELGEEIRYSEIENGYIDGEAGDYRQWTYGIGLENNTDDFELPTSGDTIGTVTINLIAIP